MKRRDFAERLSPAQFGLITGIYWTIAWPLGMTIFFSHTHPITLRWFFRGLMVGTLMGLTMGVATYRRRSERDGEPITIRRTWILAAAPFFVLVGVANLPVCDGLYDRGDYRARRRNCLHVDSGRCV